MDPELVQQVEREQGEDGAHVKANPHQRHEEQRGAGQLAERADAKGGRQVQLIGGMVDRVIQPEPAHPVRAAMKPVIAELLAEEQQQQQRGGAVQFDGGEAVRHGPADQGRRDRQRQQEADAKAHHQIERRNAGRAPVVARAARQHNSLDQGDDQHSAGAPQQQHFIGSIHGNSRMDERSHGERRSAGAPVPCAKTRASGAKCCRCGAACANVPRCSALLSVSTRAAARHRPPAQCPAIRAATDARLKRQTQTRPPAPGSACRRGPPWTLRPA